MNAKTVLSKIVSLLSKEEVELTYAKLKDGTVVESATFDVGEDLFVIGEDGSKTPAPDGEHELSLRDTEGNEVLIKVISKNINSIVYLLTSSFYIPTHELLVDSRSAKARRCYVRLFLLNLRCHKFLLIA